jgi:glycosyltransferase involved in cell wall biosynthesis
VSQPDVSLVVVSYTMERELPRTLQSLSPPYQHACPRGRSEIIVVDNGSAQPPDERDFAGIDANIRVRLQVNATVSPVAAINAGLAEARAALIGVWIDGARLASPGLIDACLGAARLHPRPVIATLNYQLGPSLQYFSADHGYDQEAEDRLLESIDWPSDGYRLFDIATSEMRHGPAGPMLETNALFLPCELWQELDGYDPLFVEPGGGVANADTLLRACALPGVQLIRVLGEATFHQFHGGLSTSTLRGAMQALQQGSRAYLRRRGRPLAPIRDSGWLFDARTKTVVN